MTLVYEASKIIKNYIIIGTRLRPTQTFISNVGVLDLAPGRSEAHPPPLKYKRCLVDMCAAPNVCTCIVKCNAAAKET